MLQMGGRREIRNAQWMNIGSGLRDIKHDTPFAIDLDVQKKLGWILHLIDVLSRGLQI